MSTTNVSPSPNGDGKTGGRVALIIILILFVLLALAGIGYAIYSTVNKNAPVITPPPDNSTTPPASTTPPPANQPYTNANFPCPDGWTQSGTVCSGDGKTFDLNAKNLADMRKFADANKIQSWSGMLCPPGWKGIGSTDYPCKSGTKMLPLDQSQFVNVLKFGTDQNVQWPGVTCPMTWTGLASNASPCHATTATLSPCQQTLEFGPTWNYGNLREYAIKTCPMKNPFYSVGIPKPQ